MLYLIIIPRAHEAEGRLGYWLRGYESESNNYFSKIQLVDQKKYRDQNIFHKLKLDFNPFLTPKLYKYGVRYSLLVGYNLA